MQFIGGSVPHTERATHADKDAGTDPLRAAVHGVVLSSSGARNNHVGPGGTQAAVDGSPRVLAQRRQIDAMFGAVAQRVLKDEDFEPLLTGVGPLYAAGGTNILAVVAEAYAAANVDTAANTLLKDACLRVVAAFSNSDPRVQAAVGGHAALSERLVELDARLWGDGLFAMQVAKALTIRGVGLDPDKVLESQQIGRKLPAVAWNVTGIATSAEIDAAGRKATLEQAREGIAGPIDSLRVNQAFRRYHPPEGLVDSPLPARASRPAAVASSVEAYSIPQGDYTGMSAKEVEAMQVMEGKMRKETARTFQKGDVVLVSLNQRYATEYAVTWQNQTFYIDKARLELPTEPARGPLGGGSAVPLFTPRGPAPDDIGQQALGDCFLLASLGSLASQKPDYLREMVRDSGGGKYAVRLFRKSTESGYEPSYQAVWLRVDDVVHVDGRGLPLYAKGNTALWPGIVEKAYAVYRGSYEAIGSGDDPAKAMEIIMGKPSTAVTLGKDDRASIGPLGSNTYGETARALFVKIRSATAKGGLVVLGTDAWGTGGTGISGGENIKDVPGLASTHAYSIFGTKGDPATAETLYVRVRNPWGTFGRKYDSQYRWKGLKRVRETTASEQESGTFDMELSDLMRYGSRISFNAG